MYTLEKEDRQRVTVASEIQKSAFLACGWKEVKSEEIGSGRRRNIRGG